MLQDFNYDIIVIIMKKLDLESYLKCMTISCDFYNILNTSSIYYYFTKQIFQKKYKKSSVKYCTNSSCPNKIHLKPVNSILNFNDLSENLMIDYTDILSSFRRNNIRIDKTMTYDYPKICEICKIHYVSYCEDCLSEFMPEIYSCIEYNSEIISQNCDFSLILDN